MKNVSKINCYLVVRANGDTRTVNRVPRLRFDEVAFPVSITIPSLWGKVQIQSLHLEMPEPTDAIIQAGQAALSEVDNVE